MADTKKQQPNADQQTLRDAARKIGSQTPRETSIAQLEQVLTLAGLNHSAARMIISAFVEKQRAPEIQRYPPGSVNHPEEHTAVSAYLKDAVDRLIRAGASLYAIKLHCDGLAVYVSALQEAEKQKKRAEEAKNSEEEKKNAEANEGDICV